MDISENEAEDSILTLKERHLHAAARLGDEKSLGMLLQIHVDVNCRNAIDRTPIHLAAGNGHKKIVELLFQNGGNIETPDKYGMDALLWAAWFGHAQIVAFLIKSGASITVKNKNGLTFLHAAAAGGHVKVIDLLSQNLSEFNINTTDEKGQTAVHHAIIHDKYQALLGLLRHKCDIFVYDKDEQNTPIHTACQLNRIECLRILLHHAQESSCLQLAIAARNKNYYTPLHLCAEENRVDCTNILLSYGVDRNGYAEEILTDYEHVAAKLEELPPKLRQKQELTITKHILTYHDELTKEDLILVTTPIHLAAKSGFLGIVTLLIDTTEQNSARILNARNEQRQTALHLAAFGGHVDVVRLIAKTGLANPSIQDIRMETPLHLSAEVGSAETTELLLQAGALPFLHDLKGKTPVEVAARGNFVTLVDMIIKAERIHMKLDESNQSASVLQNIYFGSDTNVGTEHLRSILYKLATKRFRRDDWNTLAKHWRFTDIQIRCIEEQYIGKKGYKEHGHRFLLVWFFECLICQRNPIKELYEGLVAIEHKDSAEQVRLMANSTPNDNGCILT